MTEISQARTLLLNALQQYSTAVGEAEVERVVLALHTGLEEAFRAHLISLGFEEVSHLDINFPDLVDLIRDHTALFQGDSKLPALLVALNNTRVKIAHPRGPKLSSQQVANDAEQLARLARRFWPGLFGEVPPVSPTVLPAKPTSPLEPSPISTPPAAVATAEPKAPRPSLFSNGSRHFFRRLWKDENQPRFQAKLFLKRMIWMVILFVLASWCKNGAVYTAHWPEPVKYVGLALLILTMALFLWGIVITWKILRQLRLRGLLILISVSYFLLIGVSALTSNSPLPFYQEAWLATQRLIDSIGRQARDVVRSVVNAPEEFRFAYTGYRRPVLLAGIGADDASYLTPIPANQPAKLLLGTASTVMSTHAPSETEKNVLTPTPVPTKSVAGTIASPTRKGAFTPAPALEQKQSTDSSLRPPDCPQAQARLTSPRINQVIKDKVEVMGTANIENFDYYKFEYKRADIEDKWRWIASFQTLVEQGVLGIWDVSGLPPGTYVLRLTVVDRTGNYPFPPCDVEVQIAQH